MTLPVFTDSSYDAEADVLYLSVGKPVAADDSEETPDGHVVRFLNGSIIGLTLIGPARFALKRWKDEQRGASSTL